ncbi:hypothetical protein [Tenacibaculum soleae]|uniref:hypothetical protein n=1 Tax=Tenacibaculum soleae TaxID=447689 RepID=UPI002300895E|nr:hypothetical protein [Tenacibaculum soleae]
MYNQPLKTVPVHTLNEGAPFVKLFRGNPTLNIMNIVAVYGSTVEAETLDGQVKTMSKFTLVHPLNS